MPSINKFQLAILVALNNHAGRKHIYAGTVPAATAAKRRAKDKAARAARRTHRRAAR